MMMAPAPMMMAPAPVMMVQPGAAAEEPKWKNPSQANIANDCGFCARWLLICP